MDLSNVHTVAQGILLVFGSIAIYVFSLLLDSRTKVVYHISAFLIIIVFWLCFVYC